MKTLFLILFIKHLSDLSTPTLVLCHDFYFIPNLLVFPTDPRTGRKASMSAGDGNERKTKGKKGKSKKKRGKGQKRGKSDRGLRKQQ